MMAKPKGGSAVYFDKDPDATKDYSIDWTLFLAGDTISVSAWGTPAPTGITVGTGPLVPTNTTTSAKIWLSGGTAGVEYTLTNHITTAGGRIDDLTIYVRVGQQ